MDRPPQEDYAYNFTNVQIFRDQELGHGSYGAVYKAKCDTLPCAAKLIYPVLFRSNAPPQAGPPQGKEHRQPMRRFEAECRFLSQIKHPHIVQYLGLYTDPDTHVPVLLMELMDESLTHFLESSRGPLLFHIQVNILHDTLLALAFLHSHDITHRDLSSNNVLLIAGCRAKVTDFGMSTLTDAVGPRLASQTQCPGTPAYMAPEALRKPPVYSEKLDCFSFGVLTIQVITRKFPDPADQYQTMELVHPTQPSRRYEAQVRVPEVDRRQSHISLMPAAHPLRPIALDCIKDSDADRPTAQQLCESLEALRETTLFASSIQQVRDRDRQFHAQVQTIKDNEKQLRDKELTIRDKEDQLLAKQRQLETQGRQLETQGRQLDTVQQENSRLSQKDQEVLQLRQQFQQLQRQSQQLPTQHQLQQLESVQQEVQQLRQQLQQKNQQVESSEELVAEFQQGMAGKDKEIEALQSQLQQVLKVQQQTEVRKKPVSTDFTLTWTKGPKAPTKMSRGSCAIIGKVAYFNPSISKAVYTFNSTTRQWGKLPTDCPCEHSTLVKINQELSSVGGRDTTTTGYFTNKVFTYRDGKWAELYPPMTTKRWWAAVLSTPTHVVAMGGRGDGGRLTSTEVLDLTSTTTPLQWTTAALLPYGTNLATTTLIQNHIYLMGGLTDSKKDQYSVVTCNIQQLLESAKKPTTETHRQPSSSTATHSKVWHNIPDLPVCYSTCATVRGQLVTLGGYDRQDKTSNTIYRYNQDTNEWIEIGRMGIARSSCLATALSDNSLLVVGGFTDSGDKTDETEIATIA